MASELTQDDKKYIWRVVDHAVEKAGSHTILFSNRLDFFEESGRIRFRWPTWMETIRGYLNFHYGEKKADSLLLVILREIMSEANYHAYLSQNTKVVTRRRLG